MIATDSLRNQLIAEINSAFHDVQRGAGTTLHEADLEGTSSEADVRWARSLDAELTWQDVPDHVIAVKHSALSFLDPEGFRYYAPAFMAFSLRHVYDSDSPAVDKAIYAFCHHDFLPEFCEARFKVFNEEQARVICRFLGFMAEHSAGHADDTAAREALQSYWGKFCEGPPAS